MNNKIKRAYENRLNYLTYWNSRFSFAFIKSTTRGNFIFARAHNLFLKPLTYYYLLSHTFLSSLLFSIRLPCCCLTLVGKGSTYLSERWKKSTFQAEKNAIYARKQFKAISSVSLAE